MALTITTIRNSIITSLYGRRLGLDTNERLIGARGTVTEIEDITTVATTLSLYGISRLTATGSTQGPTQHNLPAPIAGVEKTVLMLTTSTGSQQLLSTPNGAGVHISSLGSTGGVVNFIGPGGCITLIGISSTQWAVKHRGDITSTALGNSISFTTST